MEAGKDDVCRVRKNQQVMLNGLTNIQAAEELIGANGALLIRVSNDFKSRKGLNSVKGSNAELPCV